MVRNEMPLVKPKTPRLNLTKVNYRHDFFEKDYRVGKKDEADLMGSGYPQLSKYSKHALSQQ